MRRASRWLRLALCLTLAAAVAPVAEADAPARPQKRRTARKAPPRKRPPSRPAIVSPPQLVTPEPQTARDQQIAEACRRGMTGVSGSAVAMDPRTGRVIAVVNPRLAVETAYQPCSVFKVVVAIAGLTERVITPDTLYDCRYGCWFWPGHGKTDLRRALANSCNPYFEWVGGQLGFATVQKYAHLLGLGSATGVNLPGETSGVFPVTMPSYAVPHMSSHADRITTSTVQLASMMSAVVNGGVLFQPRVAPAANYVPRERWRLPAGLPLGTLQDGFVSAVSEGSAIDAFDPELVVAGKTGTCSGVGWLASFAPADSPEVVLVVLTKPGNGHRSSDVAARIYQLMKPTLLAPGVE